MKNLKQALNDLLSAMTDSGVTTLNLDVSRSFRQNAGHGCHPHVNLYMSTQRSDEAGDVPGVTLAGEKTMPREFDNGERVVISDKEELLLSLEECFKQIEAGAKAQQAAAGEASLIAMAVHG